METKISIIIPIYNSEKYLEKCLESVTTQSFKNIEILLINDGSTDNSLNICYKFEKKDSRIKIITKENSGVSGARNIGILNSVGEYIVFVDSDDYCQSNMIESIIKNINENELLIFSYNKVMKNKEINYSAGKIDINKNNIEEKIVNEDRIGGYLWNKVFKSSIIKENKIKFDSNITFCEDLLFVFEYVQKIEKIVYLEDTLYNYRIRKGSKTSNMFSKKNISMLNVYSSLIDLTKNDNIKENLKFNYLMMFYQFRNYYNLTDIRNDILKEESEIQKKQSIKKKIKLKLIKNFPQIYLKLKKMKYRNLYK